MARRSLRLGSLLSFTASVAFVACGGSIVIGNGPGDGGGGSATGDGGSTSRTDGGSGSQTDGGSQVVVRNDAGLVVSPPPTPVTLRKLDLLFDIDNSASMGDKQSYLIQAIPQMIARLVTPRCLDASGSPTGVNADPTTGECPAGQGTPEFGAVHDMHIGVVTSSLGPRLGELGVCDPTATVMSTAGVTVSAHHDDQGHLINRTGPYGSGAAIPGDALSEGGGFLYWFPSLGNSGATPTTPPSTPYVTASSLVTDFSELVGGAGESGCGIESQLESWYRFLIQPDPYATLVKNGSGQAAWSGVDTTIIQQRHDFLRPDSLVAVVVLTDENDSEIDVRSYSGTGYKFMNIAYAPPRATVACEKNPLDPSCAPCDGTQTGDANCQTTGGVWPETPGRDWGSNLNLRHVHMRQKYGLSSVQFPLTRYYNGLTSSTVPNRFGEYPSEGSYVGTNNCVNPLFAGTLPTAVDVPDSESVNPTEIGTTLCNLSGSASRNAGDVFYAHIGGVPHQLLQVNAAACTAAGCTGATADPASCATDCAQKDTLAQADWVKILGQGAASYGRPSFTPSYDYTGIDPHMIESYVPRNVASSVEATPSSNPSVSTLSGPTFTGTAWPGSVAPDRINGREWTTNAGVHSLPVDRQYACIFELPTTPVQTQRDCATLDALTIEGNSCDCVPGGTWSVGSAGMGVAQATGNSSDEVPPLCAKTSTDGTITSSVGDYTVQVAAKAYPTIRELTLASMLGNQGIVSSLCPIHTNDNATGDDPLYGYRPAVNALINRMKTAL